jgi:SET domain-containing protein
MSKPMIEMRSSLIHGNGVFALLDIAEGAEIMEYGGKRLTHARADHKYGGTSISGHTFLFTLNDDYVIDGNQDGNDARWINHSCDPNCRAWKIDAEDGNPKHDRVVIEARRAIAKGEELTYDYGIVLDEPYTRELKAAWACRCGAKSCAGTMLKPKPRGLKPKRR